MPAEDLDVFTAEQDVAERPASSWLRVLLVLIGAGVLAAVVVVVLSAVLTADQPTATYSGGESEVCGGESSCTDLTLDQIQELVALKLPEGSEIITSRYDKTAESITIEARVTLPEGAANPFDDSAYFEVDPSKVTVVFPAGIEPIGYYAATGELGALNAEALLGTNAAGRQVVAVQLVRTL